VRKIISLLQQQRYGSIITILHNMEDLSQMTPTIVSGKIAAFEMSRKWVDKRSPLLQDHMHLYVMKEKEKEGSHSKFLKWRRGRIRKWWWWKNQPSTSSSEDEEIIQHVGKVMGMIRKINLMGVPLQVEDLLFNIVRKKQRNRGCFACGVKGHFRDNCPNMVEP
jgi:hypothetical protein